MSVTANVYLPDWDGDGTLDWDPLGGDGKTAPFACYTLNKIQLTGDGSGGYARFRIHADDRYSSLWSYGNLQVDQAAPADGDVSWLGPGGTQIWDHQTAGLAAVNPATLCSLWYPPAAITGPGPLQSILQCRASNVSGDTYRFSGVVYVFDARVRELYPLGPVLWSRGVGTAF